MTDDSSGQAGAEIEVVLTVSPSDLSEAVAAALLDFFDASLPIFVAPTSRQVALLSHEVVDRLRQP